MAEYIDREALLLRIDCHGTNKFGMIDEDIRAFVKAQPAADVAPMVRCKDCQNCQGMHGVSGILLCMNHLGTVLPDDFCSYGKRKDAPCTTP